MPEAEGRAGRVPHALALISGGLDSALAIRVLLEQGIEVTAVYFTSPFFSPFTRGDAGARRAAAVAAELGVPLLVEELGPEYIELIRHPPRGYGRAMNPCIDCKTFMLRRTAALLDKQRASFVVTGEVLGQRPMSQHRQALELIARESGLGQLLLRPLSAKRLPPTWPEEAGLVDRERLLGLTGRGRKEQLALAEKWGLTAQSSPAGGCLLTDQNVAGRLRDLFERVPDFTMADIGMLGGGRHYRLHAGLKAILGRNERENDTLAALAGHRHRFRPVNAKGPYAVGVGTLAPGDRETIAALILHFIKRRPEQALEVDHFLPGGQIQRLRLREPWPSVNPEQWRI